MLPAGNERPILLEPPPAAFATICALISVICEICVELSCFLAACLRMMRAVKSVGGVH